MPNASVWVLGARATGKKKKYSDLDLRIKAKQSLGLGVKSAMAGDFAKSDLPWKVDIGDWLSVSDSFKAIIDRDGIFPLCAASRPNNIRVHTKCLASCLAVLRFDCACQADAAIRMRECRFIASYSDPSPNSPRI